MCRYCRHAFTKEEAEVEPFTMNRIIHCPFCDLPLDANNLMTPTNLAGQLSRGTKSLESTLPSLADNGEYEDPPRETNREEYNAERLAEAIVHHNSKLLVKKREESIQDDEETQTGGSRTTTNPTTTDSLNDEEIGVIIQANAAKIHSDIVEFGQAWSDMNDSDRIIAASASPKALEEEL